MVISTNQFLSDLLLNVFDTKTFDNSFYQAKFSFAEIPKIPSNTFTQRLATDNPITKSTKERLLEIYRNVLQGKTNYDETSTSQKLVNTLSYMFDISISYLIYQDDDEKKGLREKKCNGLIDLLTFLLNNAYGKTQLEIQTTDIEKYLTNTKKSIFPYVSGTLTEKYAMDNSYFGLPISDKDFYIGDYYLYYSASDSLQNIRGGFLHLYQYHDKIKGTLLLRISNSSLLADDEFTNIAKSEPYEEIDNRLRKYKSQRFEEPYKDFRSGRCEAYQCEFTKFDTHIRIDLFHAQRKYCGFILIHNIDSSTQKHLVACLGLLMNIPDSNSMYIRKIAISKYYFPLEEQNIKRFVSNSESDDCLDISLSHKDNNHLWYTYVWENMVQYSQL